MTDAVAQQPGWARIAAESLLVLLAALAYLWLFRTYGFDVVDEGTQLAQIDRVAHGARPYLDFETGYTPWYFVLEVSLWRLGAPELLATRTFGVVLHAGTIALLFAVARAWFGPALAVCLAAFDLAFLLPVSPRLGAPFNTPYPGWITAPLALVVQVLAAAVAHARLAVRDGATSRSRHGAVALLAGGVIAGVAFSVKPNAGLLALAGALLAVVPSWPAGERVAIVLGSLVRTAAIVATIVLLGAAVLDPVYALALLFPVALAAWRAAPSATGPGEVAPARDVTALTIGFLAPVLVWAWPLLDEIGIARFAREVLLLDGGGVVEAYLLPFAPPSLAVLALAVALVAVLAQARHGRASVSWRSRAAYRTAAVAIVLGVGAIAALAGSEMRVVAELACLWLGPAGLTAALVLVPRTADTARVHAALAFAAIFSLQIFPRPDLIHVAMGGPPLLLALGGACWWLRRSLASARPPATALGTSRAALAVLCVLAVCAVRAYPALRARLAEPLSPLDAGPRAPLVIAARFAGEHRWLGEAVHAITARTATDDAVFYFPDLAGLGFLAARPGPFFYVYFVPGRPDRAGELRTIAELERVAPPLAVTGAPRVAAFTGAAQYFTKLEGHLEEHYRPALTLDGCTVRERIAAR